MTVDDLVIRGGLVVSPDGPVQPREVLVRGGRIAALLPPGAPVQAAEVLDATGLHIFPGVIEPHAHLGYGDPLGDFETETRAAAAGGVTTILTFVRRNHGYRQAVPELVAAIAERSYVDIGFHLALLTDEHLDDLDYLRHDLGVNSFKFYMAYKGEEGAQLGMQGADDGFLLDGFRAVAALGDGLALVHCENMDLIYRAKAKVRQAGGASLVDWCNSRPAMAEAEAVMRAAWLAGAAGCPLYVVHLSSAAGLAEVKNALGRGFPVHAETCLQYLTHDETMPLGGVGKVNPPLRQRADREALWQGLADGTITTVGTDHVATRRADKEQDIWSSVPGFPGTPLILPVLLSEGFHRRNLPLSRIAALTSGTAARRFALAPRKGSVTPGADADLCFVDLNREQVVGPDLDRGFSDYSIYDGWTLKGWPVLTMVRGRIVARDGRAADARGWGRYVRR